MPSLTQGPAPARNGCRKSIKAAIFFGEEIPQHLCLSHLCQGAQRNAAPWRRLLAHKATEWKRRKVLARIREGGANA